MFSFFYQICANSDSLFYLQTVFSKKCWVFYAFLFRNFQVISHSSSFERPNNLFWEHSNIPASKFTQNLRWGIHFLRFERNFWSFNWNLQFLSLKFKNIWLVGDFTWKHRFYTQISVVQHHRQMRIYGKRFRWILSLSHN